MTKDAGTGRAKRQKGGVGCFADPLSYQSLDRLDDNRFGCDQRPLGVEIVGQSAGMVRCLETIRLISESGCNPVLILGETGTGKELAARGVHWWCWRDLQKFVPVNCATLNPNLLESELFGHVKGAFTGADGDKVGLFEKAHNGSIFLDEISEMPMEMQAKLLRVLQERTFRKVGGTKDISCNATIIASSNRNLLKEVEKGTFRQDLYYRLAIFPIHIPPLRDKDRRSDIPLLAQYFIETSAVRSRGEPLRLSAQAKERLMQYDWPGNVRELRNVIERAMILEKTDEISSESLIFDHQMHHSPAAKKTTPERLQEAFSLKAAECEFIRRALKETGWQRTRAAALLGITRATLHAKMKRYRITEPAGPEDEHSKADELVNISSTAN